MDRIKISIPSYSRPTFEQVKSYEKCKNILRIIGLSKKKLKFEYDFECDSDKIGSVYIRFVPLLNSNKSAEEASEKKQMLFKRGSRFSNFIECYSPFSVGKFKVLLIIEIDDKIFNFELKTIKGHADNELEEKDHIKNFSHRKTIKNEFSLFLTESAKSTKRKLKEFEYETVEHAKRREKSESMNLFNAIPTAPTIIKKEKKRCWRHKFYSNQKEQWNFKNWRYQNRNTNSNTNRNTNRNTNSRGRWKRPKTSQWFFQIRNWKWTSKTSKWKKWLER